jgi:peptidoglycan/LPS O-acetylase OafA/YrhL
MGLRPLRDSLPHPNAAPSTNTHAAAPRYDGVDVLRGLSIAAVVLLHSRNRFTGAHHPLRPTLPNWLYRLIFLNGGNGVTVFFAVSGFLITYIALRRFGSLEMVRPAVFYRIRLARIAPLLLLVLAILSTLHLLHVDGYAIPPQQVSLPRLLFSALTFHLNWLEVKVGWLPANWGVMWSLSIEEMFYLFFPPVCLLLRALGRRANWLLYPLLTALIILAPFGRTVWAGSDIAAEKSYLGGMGSIAMGCLTALLLRRWQGRGTMPSPRALLAIAWSGAILMFLAEPPVTWAWHRPINRADLDDTMLTLGTCMVILGLVARKRPGSRWTSPLRWLGRISYEVYLTHEFLVIAIVELALYIGARTGRGLNHGLLAWSALTLLLSAGLGWIVARGFTEPLNRRLRGAPHPAELSSATARSLG